VSETLEEATLSITHILKHQKVLTFANRPVHIKKGSKSGSAQRNSSFIAKLYLSLQSRPDVNVEEFFCYENQRKPLDLSNQGSWRSGNRADILECLNAPHSRSAETKAATVVVLDIADVVQMIRPTTANTLLDYVSMYLVPYLKSELATTITRVDSVWDTYSEENLKSLIYKHRGLCPPTQRKTS
jgi:hypothetical protein